MQNAAFCDVLHETKQKSYIKQTLESAQNRLEIIFKILTISAVFGNLESSQFEEYFQIPLEVKIFLYLSFYMITHLLCNQMVDVHTSN